MKKIALLISLLSLMGCGEYSPRKDLGSNITFKSTMAQGKYNFNLISFKYPDTYSNKIQFFKELNSQLNSMNSADLSMINLLIPKNMEFDLNNLLDNGWIDQEALAMKNASDLTENELTKLSSFKISTPNNGGDIQKILNEQYFLLLKINNNEKLYNKNYSYTELDKLNLMENTLLTRTSLIKNLKAIKSNFVYTYISTNKDTATNNAIFTNNLNNSNSFDSVIFTPSKIFSGFKVNKNSLIIFVGNGKENLDNTNYEFSSKIINISSPLELKNTIQNFNSSPVSNILLWNRKNLETQTTNTSLEERFKNWED